MASLDGFQHLPMQTLTQELAVQIATDFPALQSLNLGSNALRDVRHLQFLPRSLTQLNLGGNRLRALPLELGHWLPQLRLLTLRGNALESLRPLEGCKQLQTLDVGDNNVNLIGELGFLRGLTQLRHLAVDGNPIALSSNYRREVLSLLLQLQTLDGVEVTKAERLYAKLQLKTQVTGGATTPSPTPSPTRLLTPESFRTRASEQEKLLLSGTGECENDRLSAFQIDEDEERRSGETRRTDFLRTGEETRSQLQISPPTMPVSVRPPISTEMPDMTLPIRQDYRSDGDGIWRTYPESTKEAFVETQQVANRTREVSTTSLSAVWREMLLESRVEALEGILAVQDKTMRHALAQFGKQNADSHLRLSPSAGGSEVVPNVEAAATVYTRLLAAWREKCVALMVQAKSAELTNETIRHEYRQQEAHVREILTRCEEQQELWQQRVADMEAQRNLEVVSARQAQEQRSQANLKTVQAVRSLALEREKVQRLGETVARFTGGLVREKVEQLRYGASRLEALERRVLLAKDRVGLAATLGAHREARLRNSEAALEAERRVWANRLEQMRNSKVLNPSVHSESGGMKAASLTTNGGKILKPATEIALRSLFHRLDAYDTGMIRSQTFLQTLRRGDPEVLGAVGGSKKLSKLVSHIEMSMRKLSGAGGRIDTLTWGEFLLFFIPESSVSILQLLEEDSDSAATTPENSDGVCLLCNAVTSKELPCWPILSSTCTDDPPDKLNGEPALKPKERRALQTLSHTELVQQVGALLADRKKLQRLVLRDAHDLRGRVRGVRREWELKTRELTLQKDALQRELDERSQELDVLQKRCSNAEQAHDVALLEVTRLREELLTREKDFQQYQQKVEAETADSLRHEQEVWQTELQDARLAHSLLQADHSKQQVRVRQLERDLSRQKEALLAHETERVASLEEKVLRRDTELARLRRERNTILSSLREQEHKLALASELPATESVASQTMEVDQKTTATQTILPETRGELDKPSGGRMSINEISTPNSLDEQHHKENADDAVNNRNAKPPRSANYLSPEEVNMRLQKLQSLTENLLSD